jgi:hypothetical protein
MSAQPLRAMARSGELRSINRARGGQVRVTVTLRRRGVIGRSGSKLSRIASSCTSTSIHVWGVTIAGLEGGPQRSIGEVVGGASPTEIQAALASSARVAAVRTRKRRSVPTGVSPSKRSSSQIVPITASPVQPSNGRRQWPRGFVARRSCVPVMSEYV